MARLKLTHLGKTSQQLSYFIPILRELIVRKRLVIARAFQTLGAISLAYNEECHEKKNHDGK